MQKVMIANNSKETASLGETFAHNSQGGEIFCLSGDLGAGKTTFTQGFLRGLGLPGPFISPTFLIMKHYRVSRNVKREKRNKSFHVPRSTLHDVYHFDAYRVDSNDILNLGWEEILNNPENVVIIEWPERVKDIIPERAIWISFEWVGEKERKITFKISNI